MSQAASGDAEKLIQEGGDSLRNALEAALKDADGSADGSQEPERNAEPEPESEDETEDKEGEAEGAEESGPEDEPDKSKAKPTDADDADRSSGKPKSKVGKKIEKLLSQRNSARLEAEEAKRRAAEAEAKLAERSKAGGNDGELPEDDGSIEALLDRKLDARLAAREFSAKLSEADRQEREALLSKYPEAKNFEEEIGEILKLHPKLSDEMAYKLANPADFVKSKENARRLETASRTPRRLLEDPSIKDLSTDEMEKMLREADRNGAFDA